MRAVLIRSTGGPEVLELADLPTPEPGPADVVVEVAASGVNFIDTYQRSGMYHLPLPVVLGGEGSGRIVAVGADVADLAVGDRVAWQGAPGSYAEQVRLPAAACVPVPAGVSDQVAAAILLQGMTAHYLCRSTYAVQPGDVVVVHAGAGGVGLLLTQLVRSLGGHVISTVSTPEKAELSQEASAEHVVSYDDLADTVREVTGGVGVPVVYDGVGRATFEPRSAAPDAGAWSCCSAPPAARSRRSTCSGSTRRARSSSPGRRSATTSRARRNGGGGRASCSTPSRPAR